MDGKFELGNIVTYNSNPHIIVSKFSRNIDVEYVANHFKNFPHEALINMHYEGKGYLIVEIESITSENKIVFAENIDFIFVFDDDIDFAP